MIDLGFEEDMVRANFHCLSLCFHCCSLCVFHCLPPQIRVLSPQTCHSTLSDIQLSHLVVCDWPVDLVEDDHDPDNSSGPV